MSTSKKISEITKVTSLESTDLLIADTKNGTRSITFENLLATIVPKTAAAHNAIFRGKNLTEVYTKDQIYTMINNGTFDDLFIGDYFDIIIAGGEGNETVRCVLAGFDTYLNNGDTTFDKHHAVIVTKNSLNALYQMNTTNTTEGGFVGSKMWTEVLPLYNTAFGNVFGNHLLTHRTMLTNTTNATGQSNAGGGLVGCSSAWGWVDTQLSLLSEVQVYGTNIYSSSPYDTGCDNLQLPLFALNPSAKICGKGGVGNGKQAYWLRNVASATNFAGTSRYGHSYYYGASDSYGVRPIFLIG